MQREEIEIDTELDEESEEEKTAVGDLIDPFSTKDIKITNSTILLPPLINRIKHKKIIAPEYQRNKDLWSHRQMSRLIESILLKLPLPVFYFDVSNPDKWAIIDGLQRISTIQKFFVDKALKLTGLEFLIDLKGKNYNDLERRFQRTIDETVLIIYQMEAQTPKKVRYSIFNRINTGGITLNAQETRQALNQEGEGVKFLKEVCEDQIFTRIVGFPNKRMQDRELALRFIAFQLIKDYQEFHSMGRILDEAMEQLDSIKNKDVLNVLKKKLLETLEFSESVLGEKHHFSRSIANKEKPNLLNQALFDALTTSFSEIENQDKDKFLNKKESFKEKFIQLLQEESSDFVDAITSGTSGRQKIDIRLKIMRELIQEVLNEN